MLVWVFVEVVVVIVIRWIFLVRSGCGCRTGLLFWLLIYRCFWLLLFWVLIGVVGIGEASGGVDRDQQGGGLLA